ncbi:MFS transporter [Micromonospora echinofusca]|uniref:Predicted arabinose efflux permease, MFS family n=1 Tax=Micromonospora echinofusca TaxID=47858 RepID=A0A1C5GI42_MICEH|nr:MFS transporter [Micromonospora echinofusca]SCG19471.1 Predicted arabinose efflux permease, MFS family [Micromonospora echinofusca]
MAITGHRRAGQRNFRWYWIGQVVSGTGNEITSFAIPALAVSVWGATQSQLGLINAAQFLPSVFVILFAGAYYDRSDTKATLSVSNVCCAACLLAMPLIALRGETDALVVLGIAAFALGVFRVFVNVGSAKLLPEIVSSSALTLANSRVTATAAALSIGGAAVAGLAVDAIGNSWVLALDAATFVASALLLTGIEQLRATPPRERRPVRADIVEGLRIAFKDRTLRSLALMASWFNLCERMVLTALFYYLLVDQQRSATALGVCLAVGGAGGLLGGLGSPSVIRAFGSVRAMQGGMGAGALGLATVALWPGAGTLGVVGCAVSLFLHGFGIGIYNPLSNSVRQLVSPPQALGRVVASYRLVSMGSIPLGALLAGFLAAAAGARPTILIAGGACLVVAVYYVWWVRHRMDTRWLVYVEEGISR